VSKALQLDEEFFDSTSKILIRLTKLPRTKHPRFAQQLCSFHAQQNFEHIKLMKIHLQLGYNKVVTDKTKIAGSSTNQLETRTFKTNTSLKKKIWAPNVRLI